MFRAVFTPINILGNVPTWTSIGFTFCPAHLSDLTCYKKNSIFCQEILRWFHISDLPPSPADGTSTFKDLSIDETVKLLITVILEIDSEVLNLRVLLDSMMERLNTPAKYSLASNLRTKIRINQRAIGEKSKRLKADLVTHILWDSVRVLLTLFKVFLQDVVEVDTICQKVVLQVARVVVLPLWLISKVLKEELMPWS